MRVVAGRWRGRPLVAPKGEGTRPTADRVRESVFSTLVSRLGPHLSGPEAAVLDLFAGSGAMGLEAVSRGIGSAVLVERDRGALAAIRSNVENLGAGGRVRVVTGDAFGLTRAGALPGGPFSLLLLDPPYRIDAAQVGDLVAVLCERGVLTPGAVVVYEHDAGVEPVWPEGLEDLGTKTYGSTAVSLAEVVEGETR